MRTLALLAWAVLLAFFFAHVEIAIEGPAGWGANLPTWRIESHWLLDIFWGGRAMTGYHAWVFPYIALSFHLPLVFIGRWTWRLQARTLAAIMVFWLCEDFLWFVCNPAWGLARFNAAEVSWHPHWLGAAPLDYWVFSTLAAALLYVSREADADLRT